MFVRCSAQVSIQHLHPPVGDVPGIAHDCGILPLRQPVPHAPPNATCVCFWGYVIHLLNGK